MNLPRWHWYEARLIPLITWLLVLALRICWLWPWLEWARGWLSPSAPAPYLPIWTMALLFLGGAATARVALKRIERLALARATVSTIGLLVLVLILWLFYGRGHAIWDVRWSAQLAYELTHWSIELPPAWLTLLAAAGIWLRGVLDGRDAPLHEEVWRSFATGFVALAILLLLTHNSVYRPPELERWTVLLFTTGMMALALASLQLAHITGRFGANPASNLRLNRYWLASVMVVVAALTLLGLGISWLVAPESVARLFGWVGVVLNWLGIALGYLLLAVAYVFFWLLGPLFEALRNRMNQSQEADPNAPFDFQQEMERFSDTPPAELPPAVVESLRWAGLAALLVVIVVAFALALRYLRTRPSSEVDETRESIFSGDLLEEQLASLWERWRQRFGAVTASSFAPYLFLANEQQNRRAIRAIYQAMLAAAAQIGHARIPTQTPVEYGESLTTSFPKGKLDLERITQSYLHARYAQEEPSTEQVKSAQEAWNSLQGRLIQMQSSNLPG